MPISLRIPSEILANQMQQYIERITQYYQREFTLKLHGGVSIEITMAGGMEM